MTPIIGILASSMTAGQLGSYESIATVTVTSATQASIEFTNISSSYTHLQIRGIARSNRADVASFLSYQFNSDTGSNYASHLLYGDGSITGASASTSATSIAGNVTPAATATANIFGANVVDILDYKNTNKYTTIRDLGGSDRNGSGQVRFISGLWMNTNAITSLKISDGNGQAFVTNSTFALYGIKG